MIGTINRTIAELVSDSLVYRYEMGKGASDGLIGREGTFNMCTFWLAEALTRAGRLEEARFIWGCTLRRRDTSRGAGSVGGTSQARAHHHWN
jgi:GH15 family glucan-1,4-alpha-glucosidase